MYGNYIVVEDAMFPACYS